MTGWRDRLRRRSRTGLVGAVVAALLVVVPAAPAFALTSISWTTPPPNTAYVGQGVSFAWTGTANTFLGARITGCFASFPDGNNFSYGFGGNFTTGDCHYSNRRMSSPGNYQFTVGFTLSNGGTLTTGWNVAVSAATPTVVTSGDQTLTATSTSGTPATYTAYGYDAGYGTYGASCSPPSGSRFPVGSTTVWCTATNPGGATGSSSLRITVVKAWPYMSWSSPAQITYGQPLTAVLTAGMVAPDATGTISYTDADGAPLSPDTILPVGDGQLVVATYVPSGAAADTYLSSTVSHRIDVVPGSSGTPVLYVTGGVGVTGTAVVGQTLTAVSTVASTPAAVPSGQWLRDGVPVADATGTSYLLTDADAGATLTYQVTAAFPGYQDAVVTSDGAGPVSGGTITVPTPSVAGTVAGAPVVDSPLTASLPGGLEPADATVDYAWSRGGTVVGSGSTYTPTAADVGHALSVTATARRAFFDDATSTVDTAPVVAARFAAGPTASVTGTVMVGETLTADAGAPAPTPDGYRYQWYADAAPIAGADQRTYTLAAADRHAAITVEVTALRAGYDPASGVSAPTGPVAGDRAPVVHLTLGKAALRRGQSTHLTWSSEDATHLVATGGWAGAPAASGTVTVRPTRLGSTTYVLSASNDGGTTTAQVSVEVTRPATALRVAASNGLRLTGARIGVVARGLDPRERYTIRVAGTAVATGTASGTGTVSRVVRIPTRTRQGTATVRVTGSAADRTGTDALRVVTPRRLGLSLAHRAVRASDRQRYTVSGLASGEKVVVTYQGRRVSPKGARAGRHGTYTGTFGVDVFWGTKAVTVRGLPGRTGTRTFVVVRRCAHGHVCA